MKEFLNSFKEAKRKTISARKTAKDVALFKTFLTKIKPQLTRRIDKNRMKAITSHLLCAVWSLVFKDISRRKSYGHSIINSIEFAGTLQVLKAKKYGIKLVNKNDIMLITCDITWK